MKLATFTHKNRTAVGEVLEDRVYSTASMENMQYMIRRGLLPSRRSESFPLDAVKLEPPVRPSKIIAIGKNYAEHAKETGGDVPKAPIIFAKFPSAIIGNGEVVTWNSAITSQVDWEGELAVVIGKRTRNVSEEDALKSVFGYTIANDVSARDLQIRTDAQWTRGKSLDTFCPLGPWIVTANEIPDPQALTVKTWVGDQLMQDGHTKDMIFSVAHLVSYCSKMFTLEPGDLILTGTPSGVGEGMKPAQYLKDGDTVKIEISGIGQLVNTCKVLSE